MEMEDKRSKTSQFSPQAERLIQARRQSPVYQKIAAILEQEEMRAMRNFPQNPDRQSGQRASGMIGYLTRLFTEDDL